jgi:hypothetical protein
MNISKYDDLPAEFARRFYGAGKAEGVALGRVEIVLKQLVTRYGTLPPEIAARVRDADAARLDSIAERVLTAQTLDEALGISQYQFGSDFARHHYGRGKVDGGWRRVARKSCSHS